MSHLDNRLAESLGGAYRDSFGPAPAGLPEPARGRGAALTAGVVVVAAAVAVPLILANTGSGTTKTSTAGRPAVLETESPTPARTPVCGPGDVKLTAYLNRDSFPASTIASGKGPASMTAFVGYGVVTGTGATCRLFDESGSIGFVAPSGQYLGFNGVACGAEEVPHYNRTGPAPGVDPLAGTACPRVITLIPPAHISAAPVTPGVSALASLAQASDASPPVGALPTVKPHPVTGPPSGDYGVLIGSAGTIDVPADGLGSTSSANQLAGLHEGKGPTPEPVYRQLLDDYVNNPYLVPAEKVEIGTWKMRVTFGNQTVDVPFEVTAG